MRSILKRVLLLNFALLAITLSSCAKGRDFTILGYTTKPNYDERFHTVYVPIFENKAFQAGPLKGLEYQLTETVQKQIEANSTFKVVHHREDADTELLGRIVATPKNILNRNQLNEVREAEYVIRIEVAWKNVQTGEFLSPAPPGNVLVSTGRMVPELGESTSTALQRACQSLAIQIATMMEKPW
jgi:hypothetical protein